MNGSRSSFSAEAYGSFAYAYDESLGRTFFGAVTPLLDAVLARYPVRGHAYLDRACGTGLALRYFTQRGFVSTGVDASLPMLRVARQRAGRLVAGDLRRLPLRGHYALISCLYDSLNHLLSRRELQQSFQSIRTLMSGDSIFLFDMNQPEIYRRIWSMKEPFEASGHGYHLAIQTSYSSWTGLGTGRVTGWTTHGGLHYPIDEIRLQRAYSKGAVLGALRAEGLHALEVVDFDPFPQESTAPSRAKWLFVVKRQ